jgi:plasmid maintenance system antidote protein VapI
MERLEHLGISVDELAVWLNASRDEVNRWLCGGLTSESADRFEVALVLLEMRFGSIVRAAEAA